MSNLIYLNDSRNGYDLAIRIQQLQLKINQVNQLLQQVIDEAERAYDPTIDKDIKTHQDYVANGFRKLPPSA